MNGEETGRILVAGCAGFIGARVCHELLARGQPVIGVDNLNDAYDVRLKKWRLGNLSAADGFAFRHLDVTDLDALKDFITSPDTSGTIAAIINLAAYAGVRRSVEDPWSYFSANTIGTLNLLEMCRQEGIKKFVLASSSSVYGGSKVRPYTEDQSTDKPLSPYAASKKAAETLAYTYSYLHGIDITAFRYFTVYGPAGRPDMMPFRLVKWVVEGSPVTVFGDGAQSRDFTYVDDVARGTIAGLAPTSGYEIFNLGSDRPVVLLDFIRLVERLSGRRARLEYSPRHPADVDATWADIRKAERLLGWRPETPLEVGMQRVVDWYLRERDWAREVT